MMTIETEGPLGIIGRELEGDNWPSAMAKKLGISRRTIFNRRKNAAVDFKTGGKLEQMIDEKIARLNELKNTILRSQVQS